MAKKKATTKRRVTLVDLDTGFHIVSGQVSALFDEMKAIRDAYLGTGKDVGRMKDAMLEQSRAVERMVSEAKRSLLSMVECHADMQGAREITAKYGKTMQMLAEKLDETLQQVNKTYLRDVLSDGNLKASILKAELAKLEPKPDAPAP